jgi:hypothetical protein
VVVPPFCTTLALTVGAVQSAFAANERLGVLVVALHAA